VTVRADEQSCSSWNRSFDIAATTADQNAARECKSDSGSRACSDQCVGPAEARPHLAYHDHRGSSGRARRRRGAGNQRRGDDCGGKQQPHVADSRCQRQSEAYCRLRVSKARAWSALFIAMITC